MLCASDRLARVFLVGTRNSRAPSGDDLRRIGVSTSRKSGRYVVPEDHEKME